MKKLAIHFVLDRSGSMAAVKGDTIGGFNNYVADVATAAPGSAMSLTTFGGNIDTVFADQPINDVDPLTEVNYSPGGWTPLYDAIGKAVEQLDKAKSKNKVLVILTDGEENASSTQTKDSIKAMLDERQDKHGWLVIYLGANQDAFEEGAKMGASRGSTMTYTTANMAQTMGAAAASTMRYAAGGSLKAAEFTDEEREKVNK